MRRFAEARSTCPPAVARRLVELVGEDVGDLALETDKLIAYCGGETPQVEDVERLVIPSPDIKPWDITDAWGRGDAAAAIGLATADVERREDVGRVVAQLAAHVRRVHRAAVLVEAGAVQADIARELGLKPFPAQKLVAQARRFEPQELGRAVVRLAALDLAVKGGSRRRLAVRARARAGRHHRAHERPDARGRGCGGRRRILHRHRRACACARARSRQAPLIAWTIGFALFTAASLALLDGAARGWSARAVSDLLPRPAACWSSPTWRSARCCSCCRGARSPA